MSNEPRNPGESRLPPSLVSLDTIGARLTMVERCIVRSPADCADQIRELARLLGGVVEYLQHQAATPRRDEFGQNFNRDPGPQLNKTGDSK